MLTVTRYDAAQGRADEPCEWCGSCSLLFTLRVMEGRPMQGRRLLYTEDTYCENGHLRLTLRNAVVGRHRRKASLATVSQR